MSPTPTTGLMQSLSSAGYKVFAITFPHVVGNNYNHAEQIHDAIANIKSATGAGSVDIVAWSMGTLSARMYVSGLHQSWGSTYGGDVRKLILMGGPNNGWDWTFRHGTWPAIGALGASRTVTALNHLQLPWASTAMSQVASWLN
jgi:triacylglycerol esterase/lipase EstA (alpha/beta hydrolase family)